jgi:hypothetical protein
MTGAIYVAGPLDYETRKRVSFSHQNIPSFFCIFKKKQKMRVRESQNSFKMGL